MEKEKSEDQTALINHITALAVQINLALISTVDVQYKGRAHQLHVVVSKGGCCSVDEAIDLSDPSDIEFSQRRVNNRLRHMVRTLETISARPAPSPQAA